MSKNKNKDLFAEDAVARPLNEFDRLLESSGVVARGLNPGDRFRGEVLAVSAQEAFIATGTPTDAILPLLNLVDLPKTGDFVEVIVMRAREGEILVKTVGSLGSSVDVDNLEDAFDMELPISGSVVESVKGGFRVKVLGQKAFCPISQMDWRVGNPADYVGKSFDFIITQMERGRDLVVSRRKLLAAERALIEGEFLRQAQIGDIFSAQVTRIEKYGAFVRLENAIEGLVPISELSWGRINHPQEVVNLEQTIQVKLLQMQMDGDRLKVSFSLKGGGSVTDPWSTLTTDYPIGSQHQGVVERKEPYGLFISLAIGVSGLLPRSAWREAVGGAQLETKRKGDTVKVRIETIDLDAHKMSFSLPRDDEDESWRGHEVKGTSFGTLGDLFKGVKGR